ncbi:MAG: hypothetical protein AB7L09_22295 [Nitrospira sp.]
MTTHDRLIHAIVASVDRYASFASNGGHYTPSAYEVVQAMFSGACEEHPRFIVSRRLCKEVETLINVHTGYRPGDDLWGRTLGELLNDMDDLAENTNE